MPDIARWTELPNAPVAGTRLGLVADFPDGGVRMLALEPASSPFRLLVLRSGDQFFAYVNRCAHFGVPLAASEDKLIFKSNVSFSCNVHYARYRWADGYCEFGDCEGESLIPLPLQIDSGEVFISPA